MNILLDTHILIWSLKNSKELPVKARELLIDINNDLYYSVVSIWEISIKHSLHPKEMKQGGLELSSFCKKTDLKSLEVNERHIFALETLLRNENTLPHKDPFDRMLLAQAKAEGLFLLTHDERLAEYDEKCVILV